MQVPTFLRRHVFVKPAPASKRVPSGMVTSVTNCAASQNPLAEAEEVGVAAPKASMASAAISESIESNLGRAGIAAS